MASRMDCRVQGFPSFFPPTLCLAFVEFLRAEGSSLVSRVGYFKGFLVRDGPSCSLPLRFLCCVPSPPSSNVMYPS